MFSRAAAVRPVLRAVHASALASPAAGYATLREIEGRLKSIRNIEKITKTMKVIASTRLNRATKAMTESRAYGIASNSVYESAETAKAVAADGPSASASEGGGAAAAGPGSASSRKSLLIVCSSDKGLCGGIHSGLSRAVRRMIDQHASANYDLVVLGEKAKAQLSRSHGRNMVLSFGGVGRDVPNFADAQAIADQIVLLDEDYAEVRIVYNKFLNAQSYEPATVDVYSEDAFAKSPNFAAFEVDEELIPHMREYGLANSIYWALAEGHACEISARRNAMDNASKNAGDMINRYQILFNRTRQAVITGELVEIITGATASEDM